MKKDPGKRAQHASSDDAALHALPDEVRAALDSLIKHEKKLVKALAKDDQARERFLRDPAGALRALKMPTTRALEHHLTRVVPQNLRELTKVCTLVLPNGQRLTPQVRVRIGERKGGE